MLLQLFEVPGFFITRSLFEKMMSDG